MLITFIINIILAEARKKYGDDQIRIYKSKFTPMYFAMTSRKETCVMKLVCAGADEKVCTHVFVKFIEYISNWLISLVVGYKRGSCLNCASVQNCTRGQNCTSSQNCTKTLLHEGIKLHKDKIARR